VSVAFGIQYAERVRRNILSPVASLTVRNSYILSQKNGTIFGKSY